MSHSTETGFGANETLDHLIAAPRLARDVQGDGASVCHECGHKQASHNGEGCRYQHCECHQTATSLHEWNARRTGIYLPRVHDQPTAYPHTEVEGAMPETPDLGDLLRASIAHEAAKNLPTVGMLDAAIETARRSLQRALDGLEQLESLHNGESWPDRGCRKPEPVPEPVRAAVRAKLILLTREAQGWGENFALWAARVEEAARVDGGGE